MNPEFRVTAVSSSHSTIKPRVGALATMAPAFFLVGTGAVAYADLASDYHPAPIWIQYKTNLSSRTQAAFHTLNAASVEDLVIAKLDSIFENLLASQQDLEVEDHKALAAQLWTMYQ